MINKASRTDRVRQVDTNKHIKTYIHKVMYTQRHTSDWHTYLQLDTYKRTCFIVFIDIDKQI